jgi:hypothetical protein
MVTGFFVFGNFDGSGIEEALKTLESEWAPTTREVVEGACGIYLYCVTLSRYWNQLP